MKHKQPNHSSVFELWPQSAVAPKKINVKAPKLGLETRLYIVLLLLCALLISGASIKQSSVTHFSNMQQIGISVLVTFVFLYSCFPFVLRITGEVDKRKIGLALLVLSVIILTYLNSIKEFYDAKTLYPLTEFTSLLLVVISGGYLLALKGHENNALIKEQKTQIDDILVSLDEIIWSVDSNTLDLLYTNAACFDIYGYTPDEMIKDKRTFLDAVHPDDWGIFYNAINTVIATGVAVCEFRIYHRDNSVKYLRAEGRLQKGIDGETSVISGITIDITKQRLAEMDANRTAVEIENILNSINDAFFAVNSDHVITYINSEFRELYAHITNVFIGTSYESLASKELYGVFQKKCSRAMREQSNVSFEQYCPVLSKWFNYKVYSSENGATVFVTDISEQKELLLQVVAEKTKLEVQNKTLAEIAWMQSHKVRSPLANILGLIPLLDYSTPLNPDNSEILVDIKEASEQLDTVIREITDKTRSLETDRIYPRLYNTRS